MITLKNCTIFRVDNSVSNKELAEQLGVECHFDSDRIFVREGREVGGRLNPDMIAIAQIHVDLIKIAADLGRELGERDEINL